MKQSIIYIIGLYVVLIVSSCSYGRYYRYSEIPKDYNQIDKKIPYEPTVFLFFLSSSHYDMKSEPVLEINILKKDSLIKVIDFVAEIKYGNGELIKAYKYSASNYFDTNRFISTNFKNISDELKYARRTKYGSRNRYLAFFTRSKKLTDTAEVKLYLELETSLHEIIKINESHKLVLKITKKMRNLKTCFDHKH